jgi:putative heme iron utilization protein
MRKEGERMMAELAAHVWQARTLLRASRAGTLATSAEGQPFASLATPACAPDLSLLLLLSDLSEHTRHLRAEPRCSLMVVGAAETVNPQTAPRVTITGLAEIEPDPAMKARWVSLHPYAAFYADFGDFNLWRIRPLAGQIVGGFARANRLRRDDLTPDPEAVTRLLAAEAEICRHCNADHADTLALLAGGEGDWRMIAADVDGCDLAHGEIVRRIAWSAPVAEAADVRRQLITLAQAARAA